MDYRKLDAALIAAMGAAENVHATEDAVGAEDIGGLEEAGGAEDLGGARDIGVTETAGVAVSRQARTYAVFIHTTHPLHDDEARYLLSLGVRSAAPRRRIITATLAAPAIEALSETAWVRALRLSQTRTLTPPANPTTPLQPNQPD